jgi:hypothetical protein
MESTLDNSYFINYSNYFKVDNKTFAFRKMVLFDVSNNPTKLDLKDNNGSKGYWINREWYSLSKIKDLIIKSEIKIDVSGLQWYEQLHLDYVFNLE